MFDRGNLLLIFETVTNVNPSLNSTLATLPSITLSFCFALTISLPASFLANADFWSIVNVTFPSAVLIVETAFGLGFLAAVVDLAAGFLAAGFFAAVFLAAGFLAAVFLTLTSVSDVDSNPNSKSICASNVTRSFSSAVSAALIFLASSDIALSCCFLATASALITKSSLDSISSNLAKSKLAPSIKLIALSTTWSAVFLTPLNAFMNFLSTSISVFLASAWISSTLFSISAIFTFKSSNSLSFFISLILIVKLYIFFSKKNQIFFMFSFWFRKRLVFGYRKTH